MKVRLWVEQHWYAANPGTFQLLTPFEHLYRCQMAKRERDYASGRRQAHHPGVPVVIVGNITVGGSGKSPVVAALAEYFSQRGWRPGIVSRGYGGQAQDWPHQVQLTDDPLVVGDEPLMLARQTGIPVVVDPKRPRGARLLVELGCDLILSDDGLQHLALARDVELAIVDGNRGLGNGHCLPVGPLREPAERLQRVDWVLCQNTPVQPLPVHQPPVVYSLQQTGWRRGDGHWQADCPFQAGQAVHALAGIGHPQRFFDQLSQLGLSVTAHPLADHARMTAADLQLSGDDPVIMTAKDAVKLQPWLNQRHWVCEVQASLPLEFLQALEQKLAP